MNRPESPEETRDRINDELWYLTTRRNRLLFRIRQMVAEERRVDPYLIYYKCYQDYQRDIDQLRWVNQRLDEVNIEFHRQHILLTRLMSQETIRDFYLGKEEETNGRQD